MFFYFYDSFVNDKKYVGVLSQIENRLIELGINGRIEKMSVLKNMDEMIIDGIKQGAHTVVAVGDDQTFLKVMRLLAKYEQVTLGYLPLGQKINLGELLGIKDALTGCDVLAKRLTKKIDLGKVNDQFWLTSLEMETPKETKLLCDEKYTVSTTKEESKLRICNLGPIEGGLKKVFSVEDGYLNVVVAPTVTSGLKIWGQKNTERESVFPVKKITLTSEDKKGNIIIDQDLKLKPPLTIEIEPKAIKIIVGKERKID